MDVSRGDPPDWRPLDVAQAAHDEPRVFYRACRFKLRGCAEVFWFAKDETVLAQLLHQEDVDRGLVWLEDELLQTLLLPDLTEAGLRALVMLKQMFDGAVAPAPAPQPPIVWPAPKITYPRSRAAHNPREPGDESELENEERA